MTVVDCSACWNRGMMCMESEWTMGKPLSMTGLSLLYRLQLSFIIRSISICVRVLEWWRCHKWYSVLCEVLHEEEIISQVQIVRWYKCKHFHYPYHSIMSSGLVRKPLLSTFIFSWVELVETMYCSFSIVCVCIQESLEEDATPSSLMITSIKPSLHTYRKEDTVLISCI